MATSPSFVRHFGAALVLAGALGTLACDDDPVRPGPPAPADSTFHPLAVGTLWSYQSTRDVRFVAEDGGDARPPTHQRATTVRRIIAAETFAGATWALEEEWFMPEGSADTLRAWRRYREDARGLYRADLPTTLLPGATAGLDSVGAVRRVAYPRLPGVPWLLRDEAADETGVVEAVDTLATAAGAVRAYRVAYRLRNDGPNDHRRFWYSRRGILRSEVYLEINAIDVGTGERIRIESTVSDEIAAPLPHKVTRRGR